MIHDTLCQTRLRVIGFCSPDKIHAKSHELSLFVKDDKRDKV